MGRGINVEERILGMKAVEKRFLTEKQLTECLNTIDFFEPDKSLEEVFLDKGYLTKPQIKRLRKLIDDETAGMGGDSPENNRKKFGDFAIEQNMITEDQLIDALDEQSIYTDRGVRVQIGQIMFKKQFITQAQVSRLLQAQIKKNLYCKKCRVSNIIHSYDSRQIYQCETCGLDLVEAKVKKVAPKKKKKIEEDDGLGALDVIEL